MGLRREGESRLESVRGVERVEIEGAEECCGFGGLFALEMPEVSTGIMNTKLDRLEEAGVEMLVGGDAACLIHLEGGLRRRENPMQVVHIASAIAPRRENLR
ncbi:MAG: (Fe-S)-binding protein [Acidimicrobiia bacterium]|nr:(Fe-S)-binding protein [Acidimicrobiia bacterium]